MNKPERFDLMAIVAGILLTLVFCFAKCSQGQAVQSCPNGQCPWARPAVAKPVAKAVISQPVKSVTAVSKACKPKCQKRCRVRLFCRLRGLR